MTLTQSRAALLAASALACAVSVPALAQSKYFDIPAQPASTAISALGRQGQVQVIATRKVTLDSYVKAVKGTMTVDQALSVMLDGGTLFARKTAPGTYVIVPRSESARHEVGAPPVTPATDRRNYQEPQAALGGEVGQNDLGSQVAPGDIIVTAQRRSQSLQDVPISVTVAAGEALQRANITTLEQLSVQLPAVKIAQAAASDQLYIRGVGSGLNPGFEQSVGTFVDGVYRGRARSSRAALFDVERVEVLKGPQTTYFGNNAIAGAFNITTRKPGDQFAYNARALYAPSDGEYNVEGGIDLSITDALAVRFSARLSGMDGYIYNENLREDAPHLRDAIGRMNVVWNNGGGFRSNLRVDVVRNRDRGTYTGELLQCPVDPSLGIASRGQCAAYLAASGGKVDDGLNFRASIGPSFFRYDAVEVAFSNDIDVGDHDLSLISSFFHHKVGNFTNLVPTPLPGVFGSATPLPSSAPETFDQFTQEIRLSSPTGNPLEYMVGAYFLDGKLKTSNIGGFFFAPFGNLAGNGFPANTPVTATVFLNQHEQSFSMFGSATYHLTDALRVSGGLRYSHVRKTASRGDTAGYSDGPPDFANFTPVSVPAQDAVLALLGRVNLPFPSSERVDNAFLPSAVVQYDVARDVMLYGSYSRGFKAGGFSGFTRDVFDPERVNAYEIGAKSRLFDRALTLNVALFLADYSNLQEASQISVGGSTRSIIGNSASSRSKGVELSTSWQIMPQLTAHADISYLDARYVDYKNAPCQTVAGLVPGCLQDQSGTRRLYSPEWSGSVGATLTFPVNEASFAIEPTLSFSSRYLTQSLNDPLYVQPAYAKVDLRLSIGEADRWEFAVIGKNLTNKATASFRGLVPSSPGSIFALPERARSIAIQFSVRR